MPTLSADFLTNIPIFSGMTEQERSQLLQVMVREKFAAGEDIIRQGEKTRGLHIILEGSAEVILDVYGFENPIVDDGEAQVMDRTKIATIEIGATFGEVSFFRGGEHTATVRAKTDLELLTLPEVAYKELLDRDSIAALKLALNAAHILADRVQTADKLIGELVMAQHDSLARSSWFESHITLHSGTGQQARFFHW